MLFLLLACAPDEPPAGTGDGFTRHTAVRVLSPTNGETVESPFVVRFEAGGDVASVQLLADGGTVVQPEAVVDGAGELVVELAEGSWELALVGLGDDGAEVSEKTLTVRVAEAGDAWVTITSPSDGANVTNPVTFAVEASDGVDRVSLLADGWPIGDVAPGGTLTYEFSGTGYDRAITAEAYAGEELVGTDTISITVEPGTEPVASSFNEVVMRYLETYPTDGTNDYYWPEGTDWYGTTRDLYYLDTLVAEGDPYGRCYCVGLTWEVFMRAFEEVDRTTGGDGSLNGMSVDDLDTFRVDWFVREVDGDGAGEAFDHFGLGESVTDLEDAQPGDFVQFWRHSGSGHNNIFVEWVRGDDGEIEGITYWSTQGSTDGISYNTEYLGASGSTIDRQYLYLSRAWMPEDWIAWR
jgi:hypothetical protein